MKQERLYLVTYDIANNRRGRKVHQLMSSYGQWLQLSVFQCRLTAKRHAELLFELEDLIDAKDDHVIVIDVGNIETVEPKVTSLGKKFEPITRQAIVI